MDIFTSDFVVFSQLLAPPDPQRHLLGEQRSSDHPGPCRRPGVFLHSSSLPPHRGLPATTAVTAGLPGTTATAGGGPADGADRLQLALSDPEGERHSRAAPGGVGGRS